MKETKLFITPEEIVETTGMSMAYAYKLIKRLNSELEAKGFVTIRGKVSREYFQERVYGVKVKQDASV
ncbi:hypothetical protein [Candidatus Stoquefichus sp. SB1]|jgi:hypothetical protein|uniref:hypothetical protein n=1 Tax=Candidatus Stoquefichus sp. SB1 TaxID=1658109 RepID=UPI00067E8B3A|nr:hypothetical protein [Candidatus Stoquefichus sp. SB1]